MVPGPLEHDVLARIDAWWRAANYLAVGQIYLMANPLLGEPLRRGAREAASARALRDGAGPQPGVGARKPRDPRPRSRRGVRRRTRSRRAGPERVRLARGHLHRAVQPHRPGRRRYGRASSGSSRFRAAFRATARRRRRVRSTKAASSATRSCTRRGAALDNPSLVVFCVVGDGEAETGPLATSWHATKFLNPARDGAVLPILQLNEYKIANPTVLARISPDRSRRVLARPRLRAARRRRRRPGPRAPGDGGGDGYAASTRSTRCGPRARRGDDTSRTAGDGR